MAKKTEKKTEKESKLTEKQMLFCIYYAKSFNATRSYEKAYGCKYETAVVNGSKLLTNTKVRKTIEELKASNFNQRSFGERVAKNMPIQSSAADIIKIAMIKVYQRMKAEGLKSRLIVQVHDELLIEVYRPEAERVRVILEEEMQGAMQLKVPLIIDVHTGENWYEAK